MGKAMQSLKSRGYVKENFAWRHFYWFLNDEGIEFLRKELHLPPEIVPATLRRQPKPLPEPDLELPSQEAPAAVNLTVTNTDEEAPWRENLLDLEQTSNQNSVEVLALVAEEVPWVEDSVPHHSENLYYKNEKRKN